MKKVIATFAMFLALSACNNSPAPSEPPQQLKTQQEQIQTIEEKIKSTVYKCDLNELKKHIDSFGIDTIVSANETLFMSAISYKCEDTVEFILDNYRPKINITSSKDGKTVFTKAIGYEFPERIILKMLELDDVESVINEMTDEGETALYNAISRDMTTVASTILDIPDIEINLQYEDGETALHNAIGRLENIYNCALPNVLCSQYPIKPTQDDINKHLYLVHKLINYPTIDLTIKAKKHNISGNFDIDTDMSAKEYADSISVGKLINWKE